MNHQPNRARAVGRVALAIAALALPTLALAHAGLGGTEGFAQGFAHPLGGPDHVLAMIAVGVWAAQLGERVRWLIPATFVLIMALGSIIGTMAIFIPFVEQGVILSVLALGVLIAAAARLPLVASALIVALFAAIHGYVHGELMPASTSAIAYGSGFMLATAVLHGLGIGVALLFRRIGQDSLVRLSGGVIAAYGAYLWVAA